MSGQVKSMGNNPLSRKRACSDVQIQRTKDSDPEEAHVTHQPGFKSQLFYLLAVWPQASFKPFWASVSFTAK